MCLVFEPFLRIVTSNCISRNICQIKSSEAKLKWIRHGQYFNEDTVLLRTPWLIFSDSIEGEGRKIEVIPM